ncbi:histocompatibility antigen 60c-like [Arvicanthis niloticus]|uniref:histocompatibility antigen 60c-like n=1 Tax=Arvicanthis niloticus TaxID=61156 RepID=UPI00402B2072
MRATTTLKCLVLLMYLGTVGTDSLSCNFTVMYRASSGQCSVDGKSFFHFDYEKQKGNATEVCADLRQSLKDTFDKMTNLESEQFKGNHPLQVTIQSQYNQGEFKDGLWTLIVDEQYSFYFYPKNMTWRESHPGANRTMSQWENDKELSQNLRTLSRGDFSHCLKKLTHSKEMPALPTTTADVEKTSSKAYKLNPSVVLRVIMLICMFAGGNAFQ